MRGLRHTGEISVLPADLQALGYTCVRKRQVAAFGSSLSQVQQRESAFCRFLNVRQAVEQKLLAASIVGQQDFAGANAVR